MQGAPVDGLDPVAVVLALLGGWLAASVFALVGAALAHVTRSSAAAAGIGLVWLLGAETVVRGLLAALATSVPGLSWVADGLLGPAVGTLAVALGEPPVPGPFGVGDGGSPVLAVAVLVGWAAVAVALSALSVGRRDVPVGTG